EWAVAYQAQIQRELKVRLSALYQFFNECSDNLRGCADEYPSMVEKRVMVEFLHDEAVALKSLPSSLHSRLTRLDNNFHRSCEPGKFIWDSRLHPANPRAKFWFLYGKPSKKASEK